MRVSLDDLENEDVVLRSRQSVERIIQHYTRLGARHHCTLTKLTRQWDFASQL